MTRERAPWLVPFATVGGMFAASTALWIGTAPRAERAQTCLHAAMWLAGHVLLVGSVMLGLSRGHEGRIRRVRARRPGWDAVAAWADQSLPGAVAAAGGERSVPPGRVAPLVLTWCTGEVELWDGGRRPSRLLRVGWEAVAAVQVVDARVGDLGARGLAIGLRSGVTLVVCPRGRRGGGLAPAGDEELDILLEHLRARIPARRSRG
ncbi:hypothetical protein [Cellulomonas edaphi]|uniref:PH domain-containing protein n=1 Tax=Cellulomonas edaphi TaxID=3053468 RepID=A0ABT7S3M7_9CELL|nr:hypothetical protein [Cellulomons edaphi]MDM7830225.1 hypothetical protein [Cellulomons edaphi]